MKRLILFAFSAMAGMTAWCAQVTAGDFNPENRFEEGMHWVYHVRSRAYLNPSLPEDNYYAIAFIEGTEEIGGKTAMKLWHQRLTPQEQPPRLSMHLRTEGPRVYFLLPEGHDDWKLLYDFSVGEQGEVTVHPGYLHSSGLDLSTVMTWTGYEDYPSDSDIPCTAILLQDHMDVVVEEVWLNGIGCRYWLGDCCGNHVPGAFITHQLKEAYNGDDVYYRMPGFTGIEESRLASIETPHDSAPEYYTLQGLRTGSPQAPGVYICRRGGSGTKIIVR